MIDLAGGGDITAALVGSNTAHMEEPENLNLLKWKQQVKYMTTRITVIRRFKRKYSAKSLQCGIAPGLTAASPQLISKVKDLLEKSNTSEGSKIRKISKGAHFSPNAPVQEVPKQKVQFGTSEKKNGEGFSSKMGDFFKDHLSLSTIQIVLFLLVTKILEEADLLDEAFGLIIVTVITLNSRQEGTTATYNPVWRTVLKGLILLVYLSTFVKSGVNAQDDREDGKPECPNEPVDLPYNVQLEAWTVVVGIFMIAVFNVAGRINRRLLVPATAAPPLAVRPPATTHLALPAAAAAPPEAPGPAIPIDAPAPPAVPVPAIPIGAAAPPAVPVLAIPIGAAAPPAVPGPAIPIGAAAPPAVLVPAIPIGAGAPPAVPVPAIPIGAAAPLAVPGPAIPIGAAAPPAVPVPAIPIGAAAPPAVPGPAIPIGAAVPPAVPVPAIPIGFFDVMVALEDNPDAARISDPVFDIRPRL